MEEKLKELAPEQPKPDRRRPIGNRKSELKVTLDAETIRQLDQIKDWLSHSASGKSYSRVVTRLIQLGIERLDPARRVRGERGEEPAREDCRVREETTPQAESGREQAAQPVQRDLGAGAKAAASGEPSASGKPIASGKPTGDSAPPVFPPGEVAVDAATTRHLWRRDRGRCTYVSPQGRACGATAFIQKDHIRLRCRGGSNAPENLRLLCGRHNRLAAIQILGVDGMRKRGGA